MAAMWVAPSLARPPLPSNPPQHYSHHIYGLVSLSPCQLPFIYEDRFKPMSITLCKLHLFLLSLSSRFVFDKAMSEFMRRVTFFSYFGLQSKYGLPRRWENSFSIAWRSNYSCFSNTFVFHLRFRFVPLSYSLVDTLLKTVLRKICQFFNNFIPNKAKSHFKVGCWSISFCTTAMILWSNTLAVYHTIRHTCSLSLTANM